MKLEKLVPELRFKEFKKVWSIKELGSFINYTKGFAFKSEAYLDYGERIIRVSDLGKDSIKEKNKKVYIDKNDESQFLKYRIEQGDIVITTVGSNPDMITSAVGKSIYATYNWGLLNQNMLKVNQASVNNNYFIYSQLKSKRYTHFIKGISRGNANQSNITLKDLFKYKVGIPSIPEQQKIADFLTSIDQKIQTLTSKVDLLKDYKKGVMQNVFKQDIRFRDDDGGEFPDWEERKLGLLTTKTGKKNKENLKLPIYSINNKEGFLPQSDQFEGMDSNDRGYDITLYKIIKAKTFAYNPARINVGSIGYSHDLNNVIISSLYVCFQTKKSLHDLYLLAYLDSYNFNKAVLRNVEGGVRQYLFYDNFSSIKIPLPSLEEQTKIANFLTSIDDKISALEGKLEKIIEWKKGLLQKMFV